MAAIGLAASLTATHDLMPVHPLTARRALAGALAEAGPAAAGAVIAPGQWLRVRPTLSTRTVAVTGHPGAHLKLPLPASTLGLRNRRSLAPGTLADGALVHRVLAGIAARDPGLRAAAAAAGQGLGGALINHDRLTAALGPAAPDPSQFADQRLLTGSDDALADVFITITVHLCAGAIAFGLADRGCAPLPALLSQVRTALTAALDRHDDAPAARLLRARVLTADRLPGQAMVTAGALTDRSRTGARGIRKFCGTTGPNYLKDEPSVSPGDGFLMPPPTAFH